MEFVQVIEFVSSQTTKFARVARSSRRPGGQVEARSPRASSFCRIGIMRTRTGSSHGVASYEEAMENSNRDDTTKMAGRIAALCQDQTFRNFDLLDEINP